MSDLISRQAAIEAMKKQREELLKGLDKNSNVYGIISASMGIVICTVGQLPSAQPTFDARDTQYNLPIGTDLISRQAALDVIRPLQTYKLFEGDDMILVDKAEVQTELMMLPPAQPNISMEQIKIWLDAWEGYIDKDIIARMKYRVIDIPLVNVRKVTT